MIVNYLLINQLFKFNTANIHCMGKLHVLASNEISNSPGKCFEIVINLRPYRPRHNVPITIQSLRDSLVPRLTKKYVKVLCEKLLERNLAYLVME
jgi:hypothetical protein